MQVGFLVVCERLAAGVDRISPDAIRRAMLNHLADLRHQIGLGPRRTEKDDPAPWGYDDTLVSFDEERDSPIE